MRTRAQGTVFALVESFFNDYLRRARGASAHTVRSYRDSLKLLFEFIAEQKKTASLAGLELRDLNAESVAKFLSYLEATRSNSATTRNCRRARSGVSSSIWCVTI